MTLTFTQSSDQSFGGVPAYEAEFEVTGNFAIHIERTRGDAALILKQRTGGGKYALVDDFNYAKSKGEVLDYEASVTIPKFIKIVSEVEPTLAEIVTDGEVTEIKAQAKEIEVTTNGTTEVVPDSGFAYLSKVNIKTNVPTAGGGEGGSGGGSGEGGGSTGGGIEYLDVRGMELDLSNNALGYVLLHSSYFANCYTSSYGMQMCSPVSDILKLILSNVTLYGLAISLNARTLMISGGEIMQDLTIKEVLINKGWTEEELTAIPRITEEEFYNLNA